MGTQSFLTLVEHSDFSIWWNTIISQFCVKANKTRYVRRIISFYNQWNSCRFCFWFCYCDWRNRARLVLVSVTTSSLLFFYVASPQVPESKCVKIWFACMLCVRTGRSPIASMETMLLREREPILFPKGNYVKVKHYAMFVKTSRVGLHTSPGMSAHRSWGFRGGCACAWW